MSLSEVIGDAYRRRNNALGFPKEEISEETAGNRKESNALRVEDRENKEYAQCGIEYDDHVKKLFPVKDPDYSFIICSICYIRLIIW